LKSMADLENQIAYYCKLYQDSSYSSRRSESFDYSDFVGQVAESVEPDGSMLLKSPVAVEWQVSGRCNLRCEYCYFFAYKKQMTTDEMTTAEALDCVRQMHECNVLAVRMEGGEPFMRDDLLDILSELRKYRIGIFISTNGTRLDKDIARRLGGILNPVTDHIQVSLDAGCPETHDTVTGRKGSFFNTIQGLRYLSAASVRLMVGMVVTENNEKEILDTYDTIREIKGVEKFNVSSALTVGNSPGFPPERKHELLPGFISAYRRQAKTGGPKVDARLGHAFHLEPYRRLMILLDRGRKPTPYSKAGRSQVAIDANGDVYGNHHLMFPEILAGNIREASLKDIWREGRWGVIRRGRSENSECRKCAMSRLCSQRSMGLAYATFGSIDARDPNCVYGKVKIGD